MKINCGSLTVIACSDGSSCLFQKILSIFVCLILIVLLFGCAPSTKETFNNNEIYESDNDGIKEIFLPSQIDKAKQKSIFVFLDGTSNNDSVPTNIYRLFKEIVSNNDNQTVADYIEGVGNAKSPLTGTALGFGMQDRIVLGYTFITQHYQPGDKIFLFGFSRGAHTARALAGLLSYAGVPIIDQHKKDKETINKIGRDILKLTYDIHDSAYVDNWKNWKSTDNPLLSEKINDKIGQKVQNAEVTFLGVWDTVPGSVPKKYLDCEEKIGFWKRHFYWLPGISEGERYKSDSYPAIHHIAHAVSKDEKRSKFQPIFICDAINSELTQIDEVAFPGAHADVGGGYEDLNNQLPDISLKWMVSLLDQHYKFPSKIHKFVNESNADPKGLAHLSYSDARGSLFSECKDRTLPPSMTEHPSIKDREDAGPVPWMVFEKKPSSNDSDHSCAKNWVHPKPDQTKEVDIRCIEQKKLMCKDLGY